MKVLLVGNYALDRQFSMQHFARMMEEGLRARGITVRTIAPTPVLFASIQRVDGIWKWVGYFNKFVLFPVRLRWVARKFDVVHICDHSNALYVGAVRSRAHIITCHDVIAIRAGLGLDDGPRVSRTGRFFQRWILAGLAGARRVACDSTLTQDQLLELAPALAQRSCHISCGLNYPFAPLEPDAARSVLEALGVPAGPYFLNVGSGLPRKNRAHAVRIYARLLADRPHLEEKLIFVGSPLGGDISGLIDELGLQGRVRFLSNIAGAELAALYSQATALIFTSLAEGFGWPVIEAQACGCPVICSQLRPMSDIAGDAALYIHPTDAAAAAAQVVAHLSLLPALRTRGLENASRYGGQSMVDAYVEQYRDLLVKSRYGACPVTGEQGA